MKNSRLTTTNNWLHSKTSINLASMSNSIHTDQLGFAVHVTHRRVLLRAAALTSSQAWNPVASCIASRRSSASRRFSVFSRSAVSSTKLFRSPSRLHTASSVSVRSTGSFAVSVCVFTEQVLSHEITLVVFQLAAEDSTMPELNLHGCTSEPLRNFTIGWCHNAACDVQDVMTVSWRIFYQA